MTLIGASFYHFFFFLPFSSAFAVRIIHDVATFNESTYSELYKLLYLIKHPVYDTHWIFVLSFFLPFSSAFAIRIIYYPATFNKSNYSVLYKLLVCVYTHVCTDQAVVCY